MEIQEYETKEFPLLKGPINSDAENYINIYRIENNVQKIRMGGYVGAIKLTDTQTLYSNPKIGIDNVLRMYNYVSNEVNWKEEDILLAKDLNFLDLLTYLFVNEVEYICRICFRRFYRDTIESLSTIKGKILVAETIQKNLYSPYVVCKYSDFTEDILENQVLKFAIYLQMRAFAGDPDKIHLFVSLRNLYAYFSNVSLKFITPDELSRIFYDRLNQGYKKAHNLSKFFIEHLYVRHGIGEKTFFSFMINMNSLFENFVRSILKKYNTNYEVINGNYMNLRLDYIDKERSLIKIKPDIILKKNGITERVIDCKYKRIHKIEEDEGVDISKPYPSDIYQMLSYLVAQRCTKGVLVYPHGEAYDTEIHIRVEDKIYTINVKQINLTNLDEEKLIEFAQQIDVTTARARTFKTSIKNSAN